MTYLQKNVFPEMKLKHVMVKHISCDCKCKFNSTKWNNDKWQCEWKNRCKKIYSWNPSTCIFENSKNLKSIGDNLVVLCEEIIYVMDIVLTIVTSTVSINYDGKKVRYKMDCYILCTILLGTLLLFIITIICYHYAKHRSNFKKTYCRTKNKIAPKYFDLWHFVQNFD